MPHLPESLGRYPLVLRSFDVKDLKIGEILMDYNNYELHYVRRDTGELISVARDIFNYIMALRTQNTFVDVIDADTLDTPVSKETVYPAISDRRYNHMYFVIKKRVVQVVDDSV
ncbi:MAG: hypothetical protein IKA36_02060 [Clostridia bacterium]|nr:hypothetical protein [Clostridia bacterium]